MKYVRIFVAAFKESFYAELKKPFPKWLIFVYVLLFVLGRCSSNVF